MFAVLPGSVELIGKQGSLGFGVINCPAFPHSIECGQDRLGNLAPTPSTVPMVGLVGARPPGGAEDITRAVLA